MSGRLRERGERKGKYHRKPIRLAYNCIASPRDDLALNQIKADELARFHSKVFFSVIRSAFADDFNYNKGDKTFTGSNVSVAVG